ncbi:MAG: Smr/MutS family protein [Alphaproteobacteria bacterium]|jgi:DNA-nicking Smr family endonuclease|nr:Smr/MutS family protein [Alphaproteobacteria bacterium]MBP9877736.1 Smr/MutS family protein [Alphaproteobacteria bacterium]
MDDEDDTGDGLELWERVKEEAKPLVRKKKTEPGSPEVKSDEKAHYPPKIQLQRRPRSYMQIASEAPQKPTITPLVPGTFSNRLDRKNDMRIKKGKTDYEMKIDFHGMTVQAAYLCFMRTLEQAQKNNKRLILVVTGKGKNAEGGGGVIRQSFLEWINRPDISRVILTCHPAQAKDGGSGAFYLYLRKA